MARLTKKDKKHLLHFDELEDKLLRSLPYKNRKYSELMLSNIYDDFLNFCNYYNEKYYRSGFGDYLNLVIMSLGGKHYALKRYGMLLMKYLKELNLIKYSRLTIDGSLIDFYLYKYADLVRLFLKHQHSEPKTHKFIVIAQYSNMIDNMAEEYVRNEIMKIV